MTDQENYMFELHLKYNSQFGEGTGYPLEQAPPMDETELVALYERCLREKKPWESYIDWRPDPEALY